MGTKIKKLQNAIIEMQIGDTICNIYDYNMAGEIKGYVLALYNIYVVLITTNGKKILDTYKNRFAQSKIVLLEKHTRKYEKNF